MKLTQFLASLTSDPELQEAFTRDPHGTMKKRGLSEAECVLFVSNDPQDLAQAIADEVIGLPKVMCPFPTPWPGGGKLTFVSIGPSTGARGEAVNALTTLVVGGSNKPERGRRSCGDAVTSCLKNGDTLIVGAVTDSTWPNPHGQSTVTASYSIPADAPRGAYVVVTTINIGPASVQVQSPLNAFTVT